LIVTIQKLHGIDNSSSDCAPVFEGILCQAVTGLATLVASPAADHIQVGTSNVSTRFAAHPFKSQNLSAAANSTFIYHSVAGPAVHNDKLFQDCFLLFRTVYLECPATNSSVSVFKFRLKTVKSGLYWTLILPAASASEVTTIWCYKNLLIIIFIIIIILPSVSIPEGGFKN